MNLFSMLVVFGFVVSSLTFIVLKKNIFLFLAICLIASQVVCLYDIVLREPAQITWLCNVAVFLNIFLLFKFQQRIFDLYFCFSWIGCFFICLMPMNPYSKMILNMPIVWIAYWIKHITPLIMSLYWLRVENKKLSLWFIYVGTIGFLVYCFIIYFYNIAFNQNILYLNKPAPFMEALGPFYFLAIIPIGFFWLGIVEVTATVFGAVHLKREKESESLEESKKQIRS